MAQSTQIASPDQNQTDAQRTSAGMDRKKKSRAALDSVKNRYLNKLLGDRGIKVKAPKVSSVEETSLGKITTIPKIVQRNMNEIEIQPILKNFAYVRILYDTMANEYFYEAIEPKLLEEESEILDVLKEILVENLEMLDDADRGRTRRSRMVRVSRQPWECTSRSAAPHSRSGGSGRTRSRRSTWCASRRCRPR